MEITNEILRQVIAGKAVGETESGKPISRNRIKGHIRAAVHNLERSKQIEVEKEDSYGSGYASYLDVFCFKANGGSSTTVSGHTTIDGIAVYLCKDALVAVMGAMRKTRHTSGSGSSGFLHPEDLGSVPAGDWAEVTHSIRTILERHGFEILKPRELKKPLPFTAEIETNLGSPPYTIFDAFFHWMD